MRNLIIACVLLSAPLVAQYPMWLWPAGSMTVAPIGLPGTPVVPPGSIVLPTATDGMPELEVGWAPGFAWETNGTLPPRLELGVSWRDEWAVPAGILPPRDAQGLPNYAEIRIYPMLTQLGTGVPQWTPWGAWWGSEPICEFWTTPADTTEWVTVSVGKEYGCRVWMGPVEFPAVWGASWLIQCLVVCFDAAGNPVTAWTTEWEFNYFQ